jgi:rubrerythrin
MRENESVWICEFCGHQNIVMVEPEEIPKADDVTYMI